MRRSHGCPLRMERHWYPVMLVRFVEIDSTSSGGPHWIQTRRHHANNRVTGPIESDRPIENVLIAGVTTFPEGMAKNHNLVLADFVFFSRKGTAERGLDTDDRKVSRAHSRSLQL